MVRPRETGQERELNREGEVNIIYQRINPIVEFYFSEIPFGYLPRKINSFVEIPPVLWGVYELLTRHLHLLYPDSGWGEPRQIAWRGQQLTLTILNSRVVVPPPPSLRAEKVRRARGGGFVNTVAEVKVDKDRVGLVALSPFRVQEITDPLKEGELGTFVVGFVVGRPASVELSSVLLPGDSPIPSTSIKGNRNLIAYPVAASLFPRGPWLRVDKRTVMTALRIGQLAVSSFEGSGEGSKGNSEEIGAPVRGTEAVSSGEGSNGNSEEGKKDSKKDNIVLSWKDYLLRGVKALLPQEEGATDETLSPGVEAN